MQTNLVGVSDEQLVADALAGNQLAFQELVERYETKIRGYCYRMLGERMLGEDAAQEIFLKCFKSLNRFEQRAKFSTWLFSIAANHCVDCCRANKWRRWLVFLSAANKSESNAFENSEASAGAVHRLESAQVLDKLLAKLSASNRSLILMYEAYGMSYQEIASAQNCTIDSVKSRLKRIRRTLNELNTKLSNEGNI